MPAGSLPRTYAAGADDVDRGDDFTRVPFRVMLVRNDYEPDLQRDRNAYDLLRHEITSPNYEIGGAYLRKGSEGGDGTVKFEQLTAAFRWAVVFRGDTGGLMYVIDLGETDVTNANVTVNVFKDDDDPADRVENVDDFLAALL